MGHNSPRFDVAKRGVPSGAILFAFIYLIEKGNQRINGPVNAHLISEPIQNQDIVAEKTLTLITNNHQSNYSVYKIYLIPGNKMQ